MFTENQSQGTATAQSLASSTVDDGSAKRRYRIEACTRECDARTTAEAFVREAFFRTHRAHITTFMPTLLLLKDAAGTLRGVAGCRKAETEGLYLERYLPQPIEAVIAERIALRVKREQIIEVGNFASSGSRAARRFMALLAYYFLGDGRMWVTFTATAPVRRMLEHVGARCVELGVAEGACARDSTDEWGRYYTNDPRVMAGYLSRARKIPALFDAAYAD